VRAFSLTMVLAEKLITAVQRGAANRRWRDFVDVVAQSRRHAIDGTELRAALERVSRHRIVVSSRSLVRSPGWVRVRPKWAAWRRKQRLVATEPERFEDLLAEVPSLQRTPSDRAGRRPHMGAGGTPLGMRPTRRQLAGGDRVPGCNP